LSTDDGELGQPNTTATVHGLCSVLFIT